MIELLTPGPPKGPLAAARQALLELGPAEVTTPLLLRLWAAHPVAKVRLFAARLVKAVEGGHPSRTSPLPPAQLADGLAAEADPGGRLQLVRRVSPDGDPLTAEPLASLLEEPAPGLVSRALSSLIEADPERAAALAPDLILDPAPEVRTQAALAMASEDPITTWDLAEELVLSAEVAEQQAASRLVAALGGDRAEALLVTVTTRTRDQQLLAENLAWIGMQGGAASLGALVYFWREGRGLTSEVGGRAINCWRRRNGQDPEQEERAFLAFADLRDSTLKLLHAQGAISTIGLPVLTRAGVPPGKGVPQPTRPPTGPGVDRSPPSTGLSHRVSSVVAGVEEESLRVRKLRMIAGGIAGGLLAMGGWTWLNSVDPAPHRPRLDEVIRAAREVGKPRPIFLRVEVPPGGASLQTWEGKVLIASSKRIVLAGKGDDPVVLVLKRPLEDPPLKGEQVRIKGFSLRSVEGRVVLGPGVAVRYLR